MLRKRITANAGNGLELVAEKIFGNQYKDRIVIYITHRGKFLQDLVQVYPDYDISNGCYIRDNEKFIVKLFEDENYDDFTTNATITTKDYRRRAPSKQEDYIEGKITRESWTKTHTSPIFGTYKLTYKIIKVDDGFKVQIENSLNDNIYVTKDTGRSYVDVERWIQYLKDEIIDLNSDDLENLIQ